MSQSLSERIRAGNSTAEEDRLADAAPHLLVIARAYLDLIELTLIRSSGENVRTAAVDVRRIIESIHP